MSPANGYAREATQVLENPEARQRAELARELGGAQFNLHHPWVWMGGELVPSYSYQAVHTIPDVWHEWAAGLNGYLPVRVLTERWSTKWRHGNRSLRTEAGRRKKIVDLISTLAAKPKWSVDLALRFLTDRYKHYRPRPFSEYLVKNTASVLQASNEFAT